MIVLAAFILHFIGLKYGFPLLVHPDEPALILPPVSMTANSTLDPGLYTHPDLISIYINLILFNIVSFISFGKGLAETFAANQLTFYFYARLVSAVMGAALPLAAFLIGRAWRKSLALPMALLFAFLPSYNLHSHYATPDVPATLFTLLGILFAARYIRTGRPAWLTLAAILAAVNTAEKYPGLVSLAIVFAAVLIRFKQEARPLNRQVVAGILRAMLSAAAIFALTFCLLSPALFVEFGQTIQGIAGEMRSTHMGADGLGFWGNLGFYASAFYDQTGPLFVILAAVGLYATFKSRDWIFTLAFYGFLYWIALSALDLHWERWALPMYISPLMLAALGFDALRSGLRQKGLRWAVTAGGGLVAALLCLSAAADSVQLSYADTRVVSLEYCQQNGITSQNTVFESYTPFSPQLSSNPFQYDYSIATSRQHVILSSGMFKRYFNQRASFPQEVGVYERIQQENELLQSFNPTPPAGTLAEELSALQFYVLRAFKQPVEPRYSGPQILIYRVSGVK